MQNNFFLINCNQLPASKKSDSVVRGIFFWRGVFRAQCVRGDGFS